MANPPEPSKRPLIPVALTVLATAAGAAFLLNRKLPRSTDPKMRAVQGLGAGAAVLCLSVALDSGLEHFRARYYDPAMLIGPTMAAVGIAAGTLIAVEPEQANARGVKHTLGLTAATGAIGLAFHSYNILKRPGELSELNLFYGAPAGAPAALTLAGAYGLLAAKIGAAESPGGLARLAAAAVAFGLVGTTLEAAFLHYRGAFQDPAMYGPVTIPPAAAAATAVTIAAPAAAVVAKPLLAATAVLGIAGPMFHAYGIHRNMGGWHNWRQNIEAGPPLPAPPAFLGIAVAGIGVVEMLRERRG